VLSEEPYPFESDDDIEIRELDLEDLDAVAEARITIGQLAGENESWRYGHVIVDEAQDLTPMQWRMIMRRVRGRSLTIVGDLAQRSATRTGTENASWQDLLPADLSEIRRQDLTVNYRSPAEIHALAVSVLADFAPGVAPSSAIRSSGWAPEFRQVKFADGLDSLIDQALAAVGGQVAVISSDPGALVTSRQHDETAGSRVRLLTPAESKGLEFDAVVLVEPAEILQGRGGPPELYIALTRATQRLFVAHEQSLPEILQPS